MNENRPEGTIGGGSSASQRSQSHIGGTQQQGQQGAGQPLTGQAQQTAQQLAGQAQQLYSGARETVRTAANQMSQTVAENPVKSLLIASAVGCAVGLLTGGRRGRGQNQMS